MIKNSFVYLNIKIHERLFSLCSLFIFLFDFQTYFVNRNIKERVCWPHWENCREFLQLSRLPDSYNFNILFSLLFTLIIFGIYAVIQNKEKYFIFSLWLLALFKFLYQFVWHFSGLHNFELFHLVPTFAFLINKRHRIWGAQVSWALCYFLAAFVKIHESWIVGNYFSSLSLGLPFVPKMMIPFVTQAVIVFEVCFSWGLLSKKYGKSSLILWTLFHIYSVILVGFYYPTRCILVLFSLFLNQSNVDKKVLNLSPSVILFFSTIVFFQIIPLAYQEDPKKTLRFEGYAYNMIDANFQCVSKITKIIDGEKQEVIEQNSRSMHRCSPRFFLERIRIQCQQFKFNRIEWQLYQSVNGNPFIEIVNEGDACKLNFSLFGKNSWIKSESEKIVGYPNYNSIDGKSFYLTNKSESIIFKKKEIEITPIQIFILNNYKWFYFSYLILWVGMFTWVCCSNLVLKEQKR